MFAADASLHSANSRPRVPKEFGATRSAKCSKPASHRRLPKFQKFAILRKIWRLSQIVLGGARIEGDGKRRCRRAQGHATLSPTLVCRTRKPTSRRETRGFGRVLHAARTTRLGRSPRGLNSTCPSLRGPRPMFGRPSRLRCAPLSTDSRGGWRRPPQCRPSMAAGRGARRSVVCLCVRICCVGCDDTCQNSSGNDEGDSQLPRALHSKRTTVVSGVRGR